MNSCENGRERDSLMPRSLQIEITEMEKNTHTKYRNRVTTLYEAIPNIGPIVELPQLYANYECLLMHTWNSFDMMIAASHLRWLHATVAEHQFGRNFIEVSRCISFATVGIDTFVRTQPPTHQFVTIWCKTHSAVCMCTFAISSRHRQWNYSTMRTNTWDLFWYFFLFLLANKNTILFFPP